jgi:hypothetical protein
MRHRFLPLGKASNRQRVAHPIAVGSEPRFPARFDGGCGAKGDGIDDTPAERVPAYYCAARDTCPGRARPGSDPIRNYMDYTDDDCLVLFSPHQSTATLPSGRPIGRDSSGRYCRSGGLIP